MSNQQPTPERVYGPYPHRDGFKVIVQRADRRRVTKSFADRAEADAFKQTLEGRATTRTVAAALEAYYEAMRIRGALPGSIVTAGHKLGGLHAAVLDNPVGSLTVRRATELYAAYAATHAVDTHRTALSAARTAAKHWLKQGWVKANPWTDVEPVGRRVRGKRQLRLDDARKLAATCLETADTDHGALAVVTQLLLGLRSHELVAIHASDFDDRGRILLVRRSKTLAGIRELELPAVLQPLLAARAASSPLLWPHTRFWPRMQVRRLCDVAGVEVVTAHALRGMHATLAVRRGSTAHAVAAALGHTNAKVTSDHYIAAGTTRAILEEETEL